MDWMVVWKSAAHKDSWVVMELERHGGSEAGIHQWQEVVSDETSWRTVLGQPLAQLSW